MAPADAERRHTDVVDPYPYPYPWPSVDADAQLLLVGDVNLQHRADPADAFRHVASTLGRADALYGNLEGCLYEPGTDDIPGKAGWQHSEKRMANGLTAAGFDVVGTANNVMYGEEAVRNTLEVLERAGIDSCGAGTDLAAARAPAVATVNGTSVGFVQRTARYYGREAWATADSPGVAAFDPDEEAHLDAIEADVAALRSEVDVLVFAHHLRASGTTDTEPYQRALARRVVDAGADLVVGHGAHVNQGIEIHEGRPIFHCIGQFAFDWHEIADDRDGLCLRVHLSGGDVARVSFVPVYRDEDNDVYLAGPGSPEGERQLDDLGRLSPDAPFVRTETEAVLSLPDTRPLHR